jgi:hypothetical protein
MKVVSYERRGCKSAGDRQCIARLHVRRSSFEDAKKHMEAALQEHIERILREQLGRGAHEVAYLCQ